MNWWLLAYGIVVALGLGYATDPSLVQANLIEFIRNVITYLVIINMVTRPGQLKRIVLAMLAIGVFLSLLTIYQTIVGDYSDNFGGLALSRVSEIVGEADAARPGGTIGDANYYGQSLLILLPFAFYLIFESRTLAARLVGAGAAACLLAAIVYTYSRGDALAVAAMLGAAALYKKLNPTYLLVLLVAGIVALPFLPSSYLDRLTTVFQTAQGNQQTIYNETSIRGRAGAQQAAIAMFLDHPILGVGRENYPLHQLEYLAGTSLAYKAKGIPPHNLYLEVAAEHGVLGLIVLAGLLFTAGRAVIEARRRFLAAGDRQTAELVAWMGIGLFGYMVSSFFLHGAYLYMFWLQLALIIAARLIARALPPRTTVLAEEP
jgi:O-antigen ligase